MNQMLSKPPASLPDWDDALTAPQAALAQRQPSDWMGMWYGARQKYGIDDRIWLGFFVRGRQTAQWHTVSHRFCDGIGALALLLRERFQHESALPLCREQTPPRWREVFKRRPAPAVAKGRLHWRALDAELAGSRSHVPVSLLLDVMQTRAIEQQARAAGVSTTVWLLWTADRALRATLTGPASVNDWVFPVNLRGAVQGADAYTNHSSGFSVVLGEQDTPAQAKAQIAARFARLEHWRQWFFLTLGRWLGQRGINLLYRFVQEPAGRHAGSYTNLGEWNVPDVEGIICCAPGSPAYPVAVATLLCNGRRALACRLHPVIGGDSARAIEFLRRWRRLSLQPA